AGACVPALRRPELGVRRGRGRSVANVSTWPAAQTSISTQAGPASLPAAVSAGLWSANRPRPGCAASRPVLVPVTGDGDRDLRDLPWAGPAAASAVDRLPGQAARPVLIPGWRGPRRALPIS